MAADTIWMQCLNRVIFLNGIRGHEEITDVDFIEADRLALLVSKELTFNAEGVIQRITQNPENKFDDPVPF